MTQRVGSWMTRAVLDIAPEARLFEALEILAERRVRHVLVRSGETLVGLLSNRDIVRTSKRDEAGQLDLHATTVSEVMTPAPLHTVDPSASLADAAETMLAHHVNALPVLEGASLVGILTTEDLLRSLVSSERTARPDL